MNLIPALVGLYMLVMGVTLLVSSSFYRLSLTEMESRHGISCPRLVYYNKSAFRSSTSSNGGHGGSQIPVPSCPDLTLWKMVAEIGIVSGASYIIFLLSQIIVSSCTTRSRKKGKSVKEDEAVTEEYEDEESTAKVSTKTRKGSRCCWSDWMILVTSLLGLSIVCLALIFIFLGSKQLDGVVSLDDGDVPGDNKGTTLEVYPPMILYIVSIWHFVTLAGFSVWMGFIIFCRSPFCLSPRQCEEV